MKVTGPGQSQSVSNKKKTGSTDGSSSDFGEMLAGHSREAAPAPSTRTIAHLDSLLAVQGAEDPTARAAKKRMRQRSDTILSELDTIRMAMLNGTLTIGHMIDIADVVASHREKIDEPHLVAIMDEIDLRAQVELAKMRRSLEH